MSTPLLHDGIFCSVEQSLACDSTRSSRLPIHWPKSKRHKPLSMSVCCAVVAFGVKHRAVKAYGRVEVSGQLHAPPPCTPEYPVVGPTAG